MRTVIATFILLAGLMVFQSCQSDSTSGKAEVNSPVKQTTPQKEPIKQQSNSQSKDMTAEAQRRDQIAQQAANGNQANGVNNSNRQNPNSGQSTSIKNNSASAGKGGIIPNACLLVPKEKLASILGVDVNQVNQKDGSSTQSKFSRSCFFRWEHDGIPNSGVLLQVQKNPVPDEFEAWATSFIAAKKESGETDFSGASEVFKYKDFPGIGTAGAYSHQLGKYYWRIDNDYVCMIAFNILESTEAEQLRWAKALGKIMTSAI